MNTLSSTPHEQTVIYRQSLRSLVDKLLGAARLNSNEDDVVICNQIPDYLPIRTDRHRLSTLICGMLQTVLAKAHNTCIRISAKVYNDIILIHVKDFNRSDADGMYEKLVVMKPLAEQLGAYLDVTSCRLSQTTVALSFPNASVAHVKLAATA